MNNDSESALELATVSLFTEMGFEHADLYNEVFGEENSHGRIASSEVVFKPRLHDAVESLNPELPADAINDAVEQLCRDRSAMNPVYANQEVYNLLKQGVPVVWRDEDGVEQTSRAKAIDWEAPEKNDFFLAQQMWVSGELYNKRCDLVACINGIPLVFIELKKPSVAVKHAYDDNLRDYKNNTIPQLWWYNAFIILSNGSESKLGSMTAHWEHFVEWKKIDSEGEEGIISLETMIRGTCYPERLLDLIENFIVYMEIPGGIAKVVAKNHQFLGVRNAVESVKDIQQNNGRLGVFWHTQGSGKSLSMVFFCQYVRRRVPGNWTFLVVTDRKELDSQIYKTFSGTGLVTENLCQAESGDHLRQLLTEDHEFVFTLIQKFQTSDRSAYPELSSRSDIIVVTDEAHRSQYDTLAMNMRTALPNAAFIGFTGTPLMAGEERTKEVFGDYVSVYNFKQSIDDGATVPLYYENRIPELQLINKGLNDDIYSIVESAELDEEEEKKLERYLGRQYHLITRDDRLDAVAKDLVDHFVGRGLLGKGMVVSIDRFTTVRMYNKVQKFWKEKLKELQERLEAGEEELAETVHYMEETDMAVIVSAGQNEQDDFVEKGLDILSHRQRMVKEDLETKFKDTQNPLRLVFVCAMWLTGFDVPSCSTIYLDKPMRNHTLMQTIARANRVFPDKNNGLIVDYVGIFRNLQKALAIYGSDSGGGVKPGESPVADKQELVDMLRGVIAEVQQYCEGRGVKLDDIQASSGFERIALTDNAVEALIYPEEERKEFIHKANLVIRIHKAIMPDPVAHEFDSLRSVLTVLRDKLRPNQDEIDIDDVLGDIEELLDVSIAAEGFVIPNATKSKVGESGNPQGELLNLSTIDFDALKKYFVKGKQRTVIEKLKQAIAKRVNDMVKLNKTRLDYLEKFQKMIADYNSGSRNIEEFFKQLQEFVNELNEEDSRAIRENLTEEELVVYDLLTKPEIELSDKERDSVKSVSKQLLERLKQEKLVLDWRKSQNKRDAVWLCVEEVLDGLPRVYDKTVFEQKCNVVFQHVFDSYQGAGQSLYGHAG